MSRRENMPKKPPDNQGLNKEFIEAQWKPGQSGNPNGRPRRELPSETLYKMLSAEYGPDAVKQMQKQMPEPWRSKKELTVQEIMAWVSIRRALTPPADTARKDINDRVEGKPLQKIVGAEGGPIEVKYDYSQLSSEDLKAIIAKLEKAKK